MKKRYVAPLSPEEQVTLEECVKNHKKPDFRDRCRSILMSAEGYEVKEIARFFKVRTRTIYDWFTNWEKIGLFGLRVKPGRGIQAKLDRLTVSELEVVKAAVLENPQSIKTVCEQLSVQLGFKITPYMLKRFLKKTAIAGDDCENA